MLCELYPALNVPNMVNILEQVIIDRFLNSFTISCMQGVCHVWWWFTSPSFLFYFIVSRSNPLRSFRKKSSITPVRCFRAIDITRQRTPDGRMKNRVEAAEKRCRRKCIKADMPDVISPSAVIKPPSPARHLSMKIRPLRDKVFILDSLSILNRSFRWPFLGGCWRYLSLKPWATNIASSLQVCFRHM